MKKVVLVLLVLIICMSCGKKANEQVSNENVESEMVDVSAKDEKNKIGEEDLLTLDTSEVKKFDTAKIFEDKKDYPEMDGSTALLPLMAQVRSDVLGVSLEEAENDTTCNKTARAWYNLSAGIKDILIVGEMPIKVKHEIINIMNLDRDNVKQMHEMIYAPIRREGLVFIVNKNNPVESLTKEQLIDIYTGKITNWKEVGGEDEEIEAFQRNEDSGSQAIFRKVLMKDIEPTKKEEYYYPAEMNGLIDVLSTYNNSANAIGYSVYYYVTQMYNNDNLKLIKVDGVMPNNDTIGDMTYPLLNESYVAIRKDEPENSNARKLYDFIRSVKGKESVRKAGYVPVK